MAYIYIIVVPDLAVCVRCLSLYVCKRTHATGEIPSVSGGFNGIKKQAVRVCVLK